MWKRDLKRGHFLASDPRREEAMMAQGGHRGTDSFLPAALLPRVASAVWLGGVKSYSAMRTRSLDEG